MLLLYDCGAEAVTPGTPEFEELVKGYAAFDAELRRRGMQDVPQAPLDAASTASTLRIREDRMLITDGPFAETKEELGGFYLVDCADRDEALKLAAMIPAARYGAVEVRPVREINLD
ncbi:MAG: YciI family protein [Hyphomicrobiales bacterium]